MIPLMGRDKASVVLITLSSRHGTRLTMREDLYAAKAIILRSAINWRKKWKCFRGNQCDCEVTGHACPAVLSASHMQPFLNNCKRPGKCHVTLGDSGHHNVWWNLRHIRAPAAWADASQMLAMNSQSNFSVRSFRMMRVVWEDSERELLECCIVMRCMLFFAGQYY